MNWIIYATLSVIKLLIISVLILISALLMPVIFLLFSLGFALSYVRDVEPTLYARKFPALTLDHLSIFNLKDTWLYLYPPMRRIQHVLIKRDKTIF